VRSGAVVVDGVSLAFGEVAAVDNVSLDVRPGEILSLLGPSGSGKSTLLRIIAGLARPQRGRILLDGREVSGPGVFVEPEHRRVGMMFQDYALFPHLTVAANVAFGLSDRRTTTARRIVTDLLDRLGLAGYASSYPHMLSGGERQRVALARALAPVPRVLLMDEPFSGLDGRLRDRVRSETMAVLHETRTTTIVVTHDPTEAMRIADRLALLCAGRLVQCGAAGDVYARPATAFAARFLSDVNELPGMCRCGRVATALGSFAAPGLPDDTAVRVCIRPQHVRPSADPTAIRATVVSCEFLGDARRMTLDVPGLDAPVWLLASNSVPAGPGNTIYLDVDESGVVVCPPDDHSVQSASSARL
jgi:iron(III) transport system ATP-binding protein